MKQILRFVLFVIISFIPQFARTQFIEATPDGEVTIGVQSVQLESGYIQRIVYTPKGIFVANFDSATNTLKWFKLNVKSSDANKEDIADAFYKKESSRFVVLTKSGKVYTVFPSGGTYTSRVPNAGNSVYEKIKGDAIYTLTDANFYVSRDTAITWQVDTAGLGSSPPKSFDIDSSQYVYIAHPGKGIFRQHTDSMVWNKLASFPGVSPTFIFIDRKQRIVVASNANQRIYLSTDRGSTWAIDTVGFTKEPPLAFCDDVFGNLYMITAPAFPATTKIFRSLNGTQPWTRIDAPLTNLLADPASYAGTDNAPFRSIGGDSILIVAGAIGVFFSIDHGTTWKEANTGIESKFIMGYAKTSTNRSLASTDLGLYYKDPNSSQWTKSFPAQGYFPGYGIGLDAAGNAYTLGVRKPPTNLPMPMKSIDGGKTWNPDTSGFYILGNGSIGAYFVDELGREYISSLDLQGKVFTKKSGDVWRVDSVGYYVPGLSLLPIMFSSDGKGTVYLGFLDMTSANNGFLLSRPRAGGTWTADTVGLGVDQVWSFTHDKAGTMYCGTFAKGFLKKGISGWQKVSLPQGFSNSIAAVLSCDSSGALFAGLSGSDYVPHGVYFTKDGGTNWAYAGLDQVGLNFLTSYGDTTYAISALDGVYKLTRNTPAVVSANSTTPLSFTLYQNYPDPFNPSTTIEFELPIKSYVRLEIFNILGQRITTLYNGEQAAGYQKVLWNANVSSGIYFYRIDATSLDDPTKHFVDTKKMLLLR